MSGSVVSQLSSLRSHEQEMQTLTTPALSMSSLVALEQTARALCRPGHGILAADESTGTIGKRLLAHGVDNVEENRRAYREVLLCAEGNERALGGAILFDETFYQCAIDGRPFPRVLCDKGVLVGIKVDTGLRPLRGCEDETYTSGIDAVAARCKKYAGDGARFAKWRAALRICQRRGLPSPKAIQENAELLARYANAAIEAGLVPIVEPEILIDGSHSQRVSALAARDVITAVYAALQKHQVPLSATLLKPMMVLPGREHPGRHMITPEQVARATLDVMKAVVPSAVGGIVFLSGGMSEAQATENLHAINLLAQKESAPWSLSFSFGRALQSSALQIWARDRTAVREASNVAAQLAIVNGQAQLAQYDGTHPSRMQSKELYEGFRGWRSGDDKKGT